MLVAVTFVNTRKKSTRRACQELSIPRTTLGRLMDKLKLKRYCSRQVHGLLEDDPDRQLRFCKLIHGPIINEQPAVLDKIIWSDKACFKLSENVNRHNRVNWANKNLHLTIESQLNQPDVTTRDALSSEHVIGPMNFDGTAARDNYSRTLHDVVEPQLQTSANFDELHFQQDGVPPHYARTVREYLDQAFPQRWFGRRGNIEWQPGSPDQTPMEFLSGV